MCIAEQNVFDERDNEEECPNGGVKQEIKINKDEESRGGVKGKDYKQRVKNKTKMYKIKYGCNKWTKNQYLHQKTDNYT